MQMRMACRSLCLVLALAVSTNQCRADLIVPVSASGTGSFFNSPLVLIDGVVPPRNTGFAASTNVAWATLIPAFTIDLGKLYNVQQLTIAVDNNDDYLIQYSTDGISYSNLFQFLASDGPVTPAQQGLDILTTNSSFPIMPIGFPIDLTTPAYVGRGFSPVNARYLRISANGGDDFYGIGEVQAFGTAVAVPVPSGMLIMGIGIMTLAGYQRFIVRKPVGC